MTVIRQNLPGRRACETLDFSFSRGAHDIGTHYTASLGRYPDGQLGEVFLDCHKVSSAMTDDARDVAVTVSVALQHGVPLDALSGAVARHEDGRPCGLTGRLIEAIAEHEAGGAVGLSHALPTPEQYR